MKKILFFIDNLLGGGAEKAIKIHVENMTNLGYDVELLLLENQKVYDVNKNVKISYLTSKVNKFNYFLLFYKFLKYIKKNNIDIVVSTNTKSDIISLLTKLFSKNIVRIVNIQVDLKSFYSHKKNIFNILKWLYNTFADRYYFISKGLYERFKKEVNIKDYFIIYNPISLQEINVLKYEKIDEKYEHIFKKPVIINIGRLVQQKGQWILIEAFAKLEKDYNLVILGIGEKEKELKELIKKLNLENKVFFLGFQKNPFKYLYNSDLFVLSSLWEGFGNVLVEAMECELPIISTDCPSGPREVLAPNTNISTIQLNKNSKLELAKYGILVPMNNSDELANAMNLLLENENLKQDYKLKAIQRAKDFNENMFIKEYKKFEG